MLRKCSLLARLILFCEKIPDFRATAAIKQQRLLCRILGGAALVAAGGGCGHGITMLIVEAVGIGGGGRVEGLGGGRKGKRNGRI